MVDLLTDRQIAAITVIATAVSAIATIISAIGTLTAAWAARTSAKAARDSSAVAQEAIKSNQLIAGNDWRIRLMEERMIVWRAFDDLMKKFMRTANVSRENIVEAQKQFQFSVFIFDKDIDNYLKEITFKLLRHCQLYEWANRQTIDRLIESEPEEIVASKATEKYEIEQWLVQQQQDGKALFMKHMSLID